MNTLKTKRPFYLPRIGQRIVKTSIAVLITLLVYYLRGYRGADMPAEAAITAIICMQPYVHDTREYAVSRFIGTLIGAVWGLGFLLLMLVFPRMGEVLLLVYLRMAIGVMLTLYTCVLVRRPDTAGQAAIVFICVVIAFPAAGQGAQPCLLHQALRPPAGPLLPAAGGGSLPPQLSLQRRGQDLHHVRACPCLLHPEPEPGEAERALHRHGRGRHL